MVFTTQEEERIRRVLDAVVDDVGPAREFETLSEREHVVRLRAEGAHRRNWKLAVAGGLAGVTLIGASFMLLGAGPLARNSLGSAVATEAEAEAQAEAEAAAQLQAEAQAQAEAEALAETERAAAAAAAQDAATAPIFGTETFTGEGLIASDVALELKVAGRSVLEWGGAAGEPWALVTFGVAEDPVGQKPAMACITILPLVGENYCASPPGDLNDQMYAIGYSIGGDGGVVFVHAIAGVAEVRVETTERTWTVAVHGESGGYPPSAVIPTPSHRFVGTLTALDAAGNQIGDPVTLAFTSDSFFPETPLGG